VPRSFELTKREILHVLCDRWAELPRPRAHALLLQVQGTQLDALLTYDEVAVSKPRPGSVVAC
jgi:hypothetical protein